MSRKNGLVALSALFLIMVATPAIAAPMQDEGAATGPEDVKMAISLAAAFAMGIASGACGLGQGRAARARGRRRRAARRGESEGRRAPCRGARAGGGAPS